jgi:protein tyrosine/serine phosphatase
MLPMASEHSVKRNVRIKHFSQVAPWLYRGGQPDGRAMQLMASELGVKTVISLRWNPRAIAAEEALLKQHGLAFHSIPLNYWDLPGAEIINRFFSLLDDSTGHPIFLHCVHGSDRTGLLVAYYRIARQNWTADAAYSEMRQHGFHRVWMPHFKWAVYEFERTWKQRTAID